MATNIVAGTGCLGKNIECTGLLDDFSEDKVAELSGLKIRKKLTGTYFYECINY